MISLWIDANIYYCKRFNQAAILQQTIKQNKITVTYQEWIQVGGLGTCPSPPPPSPKNVQIFYLFYKLKVNFFLC